MAQGPDSACDEITKADFSVKNNKNTPLRQHQAPVLSQTVPRDLESLSYSKQFNNLTGHNDSLQFELAEARQQD